MTGFEYSKQANVTDMVNKLNITQLVMIGRKQPPQARPDAASSFGIPKPFERHWLGWPKPLRGNYINIIPPNGLGTDGRSYLLDTLR